MERSYLEQRRFFAARYDIVKSTLVSLLNNAMFTCPECLKAIEVWNIGKCLTPDVHSPRCRAIGGGCGCGSKVIHLHKAEILQKIIEES